MGKITVLGCEVLAVIEQFRPEGFFEAISESTKLTKIFGENQWNTLGVIVVRAELEKEFGIEISDDAVCVCETVGDIQELVIKIYQQVPRPSKIGSAEEFLCGMFP
jgi:acyl carrier protein